MSKAMEELWQENQELKEYNKRLSKDLSDISFRRVRFIGYGVIIGIASMGIITTFVYQFSKL